MKELLVTKMGVKIKTMKKLIFLLTLPILIGCSSTKTLKFSKTPDNIVTTKTLKDFLSNNKNPKVVLRVSDASYTVTEDKNIDYLYNAIENQLL